jgi:hypothetical protein
MATGNSMPWPLWTEQAYASARRGASSFRELDRRAVGRDDERLVVGAVGEQPQHRPVHQAELVQVAPREHELVADAQLAAEDGLARRVERRAQALVERVDPERPAVDRREDLHVLDGSTP